MPAFGTCAPARRCSSRRRRSRCCRRRRSRTGAGESPPAERSTAKWRRSTAVSARRSEISSGSRKIACRASVPDVLPSRHPGWMAEPQSPTYPSARVIAELAREAQRQQLHSIEALDSKAATLIGFGGVLLGLVFSSSIATRHWNLVLTIGVALLAAGISGL